MALTAAQHLSEEIERNLGLAEHIMAPGFDRRPLERLQDWQRHRLSETYADLWAQERYRPACQFFIEELYGGLDFLERDRQLERAAPIMRRLLPDYLLQAIADAMKLQAISIEMDLAMSECLQSVERIDQPAYAEAYRTLGHWDQREEQIRLFDELGEILDRATDRPMVFKLARLMRGPARAAGFGALQDFLEHGLSAFGRMGSADYFLDTLIDRETRALEAMRKGGDWPFEPWIGHGPATDGVVQELKWSSR